MQASVYGRADGASMGVEEIEDEPEVESRFSAVEEVGNYYPEELSCAGGDNWSEAGSYCESTTRGPDGCSTSITTDIRPAK